MRRTFAILLVLVAVSCAPSQPEQPVCNSPYYEWQAGQCCLDKNNNQICDSDEQIQKVPAGVPATAEEEPVQEPVKEPNELYEEKTTESEETVLQEKLKEAPSKYWFIEEASADTGQIVYGNKRSLGEYDDVFGGAYWNADTNELYLSTWQFPERWWNERENITTERKSLTKREIYLPAFLKFNLTGDREKDNAQLPYDVLKRSYFIEDPRDRTKAIDFFYVKSPIDWMREYKEENPIKIETAPYTISLLKRDVTSNLALHYAYKEDPSKTLIMRFDDAFDLPLFIEVVKGARVIDRYRFIFDIDWYKEGRRVEITEKLVSLPEKAITVTDEDVNAYLDYHERAR